MITEDYVSFEVAKLLKEKGFDGMVHAWYSPFDKNNVDFDLGEIPEAMTKAPTLQIALKWLREKGIAALPILSSILDNEKFLWDVEIIIAKTNETYHQGWIYENYEEACEAAIKYCLTNLIK